MAAADSRQQDLAGVSYAIEPIRSPQLAKGKKKEASRRAATETAAVSPPKMSGKAFEKELEKLQVELTRLQAWTVAEGARVIVVFEGRIRPARAA